MRARDWNMILRSIFIFVVTVVLCDDTIYFVDDSGKDFSDCGNSKEIPCLTLDLAIQNSLDVSTDVHAFVEIVNQLTLQKDEILSSRYSLSITGSSDAILTPLINSGWQISIDGNCDFHSIAFDIKVANYSSRYFLSASTIGKLNFTYCYFSVLDIPRAGISFGLINFYGEGFLIINNTIFHDVNVAKSENPNLDNTLVNVEFIDTFLMLNSSVFNITSHDDQPTLLVTLSNVGTSINVTHCNFSHCSSDSPDSFGGALIILSPFYHYPCFFLENVAFHNCSASLVGRALAVLAEPEQFVPEAFVNVTADGVNIDDMGGDARVFSGGIQSPTQPMENIAAWTKCPKIDNENDCHAAPFGLCEWVSDPSDKKQNIGRNKKGASMAGGGTGTCAPTSTTCSQFLHFWMYTCPPGCVVDAGGVQCVDSGGG